MVQSFVNVFIAWAFGLFIENIAGKQMNIQRA